MRVLLLNQAFYPDVAATAQHLSDLAVALVARGHDVTVVCSRRGYDNQADLFARREEWRGVHIRRISGTRFGKKARWRRAADFGSYILHCALHLAGLPRFDLVVGLTSPPLISWLGALFVRIKGGQFVFWSMDLNPDEAVAAGWLKSESRMTRLLMGLLHYSLRQATTIVALDRFMARRIEAKGIAARKVVVIPPWSRDDVVKYDEPGRREFRTQYGLDGKYVVMYSGNHSPCHPLSTLLQAVRSLRARDDIQFCFIGGGSEFAVVKRVASEECLPNVTTIPYQPEERVASSLSAADLHVVVMGDPFVGIVHPCKVYNIRTLGIPFLYIGPEASHATDLEPAFCAEHGDVGRVVECITTAAARARHLVSYSDLSTHSRERLLPLMAVTLEDAVFRQNPVPTLRRAIG